MKRLHREREKPGCAVPDRQEAQAFIAAQFEALVAMNRAQYGHLFQTHWMYNDEWCPCCARRKIEAWTRPVNPTLSLNTFLYNEEQVLIGYRLCQVCALDLIETLQRRKALMHQRIERCLMAAYERYQAETAPPRGAESST